MTAHPHPGPRPDDPPRRQIRFGGIPSADGKPDRFGGPKAVKNRARKSIYPSSSRLVRTLLRCVSEPERCGGGESISVKGTLNLIRGIVNPTVRALGIGALLLASLVAVALSSPGPAPTVDSGLFELRPAQAADTVCAVSHPPPDCR